jgi:hypothetical protein
MANIFDEILNIESECVDDDYQQGFNDGLVAAVEAMKNSYVFKLRDREIREIYEKIPKFNSKENIQRLFARAIEQAVLDKIKV